MTGIQMCRHIAKAELILKPDGRYPTAEEIWNNTPTSELYKMNSWYEEACRKLGYKYGEEPNV
jgi:hypothetical protein